MSRIIAWLWVCLLLFGCVIPMAAQGTQDYVPLWTNSTTLGNSVIYQSGTTIGINTTTPRATLGVNGSVSATGFLIAGRPFAFGSYEAGDAFLGFAGNTTTTGMGNTASGYQALFANTTGISNTASGVDALYFNTMGGNNAAIGDQALFSNTTGSYNTGCGSSAVRFNATGNYNTALGYNAGPLESDSNLTNTTAIGAYAWVSESNAMVLGGMLGSGFNVNVGIATAAPSNVFTIAQNAGHAIADGWDTYSSRRWKTNIQTLHGALAKVEQLRGVSYNLKDSGKHEIGVIAEEVGAVVPEVVAWEKNGKDAEGVDYGRLTALLIEAVKQQQREISALRAQLRKRAAKEATLESRLERLEQDRGQTQLASARPVR